jgi:hypothetical protein
MQVANRQFNLWALVQPAEDMPGQWVAHCLDLDVVTYGTSPKHAFEMVCDAAKIVLLDDLNRNHEPLLRRAPDELWRPLWEIANHGKKCGSFADLVREMNKSPDGPTAFKIAVVFVLIAQVENSQKAKHFPPKQINCALIERAPVSVDL